MLNIALFGPPGTGKGTQSKALIKAYDLFYISMGDLLRKEVVNKTEIGKEIDAIISKGGLASDEIIVQIIENTITENPDCNGFLFDGFPRTYVQAYIMDGLMLHLNTSLNCLINIKVPERVSMRRLIERGKISGRSDDNKDVIRTRLKEYKDKTVPVLQYYKDKDMLFEVNGTLTIKEVSIGIKKIIKKELSKRLFNIVITGFPGSGRSSQGKALAKKFGLEYVSTGEMLEQEIEKESEIGLKVKSLFEKALPVPDKIVVQLIERKLKKRKNVKGFLFKGFPRTRVQSYILEGLFRKMGSSVSKIIEIDVPVLELIDRLGSRSSLTIHSPYDVSTKKIVKRLKDHEVNTIPVIERFRETHGLEVVNGIGTFEEVFERTSNIVQTGLRNVR